MASASPLFDKTLHLRARWVRANYADGAFAVGAVSAYVSGRSSFAGRAISSPHGAADIAFTGIAVPQSVTLDREEIWLLADRLERKPDGDYRRNAGHMPRIATHLDAALPWGIGDEAARRVVEGFSRWVVDTYGVVVEYAAHHKEKPLDHAHFLIGTRALTEGGYGKKIRALNGIAQQHADRKTAKEIAHAREDGTIKRVSSAMDEIRARWAALVAAEIGHMVDHRSYERRGLDIAPVPRVRRGEIEFQKRVERRTGTTAEWRKDRARRLAARNKTPTTATTAVATATTDSRNAGTAPTARRPPKRVKTVAVANAATEMANRFMTNLREEIAGREIMEFKDRLQAGRGIDADGTVQGERALRELTIAPAKSANAADAASPRWHRRSEDISRDHEDARAGLVERQQEKARNLGRRQSLVLALVEMLVQHDAILAMRHLAECARRFRQEGKALTSTHDQQWLTLFATQRGAWRDARENEVEHARRAMIAPVRSPPRSMALAGIIRRQPPSVSDLPAHDMAMSMLASLQDTVSESFSDRRELWKRQTNDDDARAIAAGSDEIRAKSRRAWRFQSEYEEADAAVVKVQNARISRWQGDVLALGVAHNRSREDVLRAQENEETELRRRQRLALLLLELLIPYDALLALHRLVTAAKRFKRETSALLERQGQDWIDLVAAQRKTWPSLPAFRQQAALPDSFVGRKAENPRQDETPPAVVVELKGDMNRSTGTQSGDPTRPTARSQAHVRIVEEIADWLALKHQRSSERTLILATYLGEPADQFDARTNQRRDAALEQARSLGPGYQARWAPRPPNVIIRDPVVVASADLRDLVERVGKRSKSLATPHRHQPASGSIVGNSNNRGKDRE